MIPTILGTGLYSDYPLILYYTQDVVVEVGMMSIKVPDLMTISMDFRARKLRAWI
jgi:hypothetical protein